MQGDLRAGGGKNRRLFAFNAGFWRGPRLRRILELSGWNLRLGLPGAGDHIAIWGNSPTAWRGHAIGRRRGAGIITVEDAFLRSVLPGRAKGRIARRGPIGLLVDPVGLHFDPSGPSLIENLIAQGATTGQEQRAREAMARLQAADLSKYNGHRPELPAPHPGYVMVIDQTRNDASLMGAGRERFLTMLDAARREHPDRPILLRSHPETINGLRPGHLDRNDLRSGDILCDQAISPWRLVRNAHAVYAVSSQLGYEAMPAGHRPRLFGQPFYAGWGLSDDEYPLPTGRRGPAQVEALFAASHLLAPIWYDPCRDRLSDFEGALNQIEAEVKAFRQDRDGHLAFGMRLWKRPAIARAFGEGAGVRFTRSPRSGVTLAWAGKADLVPGAIRVEDGFLRSRGLGAELTPPLSLVADDLGIYYDPTRESRLERLIADGPPPGGCERARHLIAAIRAAGLSKYNLSGGYSGVATSRRRILVPGQVEDDASIRLGAGRERTNPDLLRRVRQDNPNAHLIFKPHPDVEAGLRLGAIDASLADEVATATDPIALLSHVDEVWTMTSTLGFEALLRGVPVTTLGAPFYAGWGLTRDLGPVPQRRTAQPDLAALVHACLIAYPRYRDPVSGLPCPVEVVVDRLSEGTGGGPPMLRLLAKVQGILAGHSWLWRR